MRTSIATIVFLTALSIALAANAGATSLLDAKLVGDEVVKTTFADIKIEHNHISDESSQVLFDQKEEKDEPKKMYRNTCVMLPDIHGGHLRPAIGFNGISG